MGIEDVTEPSFTLLSEQGTVVVKDAVGEEVKVFDISGRLLQQGRIESNTWRYTVHESGIYLVQIADRAAQKVVAF